MRKFFLGIFLSFFLLFITPHIFAQESGWKINTFESQIDVLRTGEIVISEILEVDYGGLQKHGIFRDLPYVYDTENGKHYTEVIVENVLRDGQNEKYSISKNNTNLQIKIGDPNKTISGSHTYKISYRVKGVILSYEEFDELYWNATGVWPVPIDFARSIVRMPENSILQSFCYVGYLGEEEACETVMSSVSASFSATQLETNEQMSVAIGFKKGIIPILTVPRPKTFFEQAFMPSNIMLFLLPVIGGAIFIVSYWYKNGRDFWNRGGDLFDKNSKHEVKPLGSHETIVVEYTPPEKLPPAVLGILMDQRADTLDVTSTIIDLASRGYFTITEIPKKWMFGKVDYELSKTSKITTGLLSYEKLLVDELFDGKKQIKTSELKNKFYSDLLKVKKELYEYAVRINLFPQNPESIRGKYFVSGIIVFVASIFATIFLPTVSLKTLSAGLIILSVEIIIFSRFMPRRTAYGRELYRRTKGYYEFISHVEKYRQQFFERKNMLNEVLPYAIVFGLTSKFAAALKEMGVKPESPSWYTGAHAFNVVTFGNNINTFSSSLSSAISSAPRSSGSSGGGSSGGGFGGGGGGSW